MAKEDAAATLPIGGHEVRITHPDKPYFTRQAKLSKLDLVHYFLSVAPGAIQGLGAMTCPERSHGCIDVYARLRGVRVMLSRKSSPDLLRRRQITRLDSIRPQST